ncbi:hypothetical protein [Acetobacterium malicum]|uniref:hypothetical protein n=1 Tax=Acetobacterium malicum TaxID=52692 RepID=UPI00047B23DB|nr:hypothetical protein [Acetobacterium dehalogenans]
MKLQDILNQRALVRPIERQKNVSDGSYFGKITQAELLERESAFSEDGKQIVLNVRTEVIDNNGDCVELYYSVNYTWSNKGRMVKFLEKLELLPAPGETLELDTLVGLSVQVIIENVIKENVTYSNIVSMKRRDVKQHSEQSIQQPERSLPDMLQSKQQFDIEEHLDIN